MRGFGAGAEVEDEAEAVVEVVALLAFEEVVVAEDLGALLAWEGFGSAALDCEGGSRGGGGGSGSGSGGSSSLFVVVVEVSLDFFLALGFWVAGFAGGLWLIAGSLLSSSATACSVGWLSD